MNMHIALSTAAADPIDAALDALERAQRTLNAADRKLDKAKGNATGRPSGLIVWRDFYIGGSEIETRRQALLKKGELPHDVIEAEFLDAKQREAAQLQAAEDWDAKNGLTELRAAYRAADAAWYAARDRALKTRPTTPAGAARAVAWVARDIDAGTAEWHTPALRKLAAALRDMGATPAPIAPAEPDPIYAAIETHRRANAEFRRECASLDAGAITDEEETTRVLCRAEGEALHALSLVTPTTPAGAQALLAYIVANWSEHTANIREAAEEGLDRMFAAIAAHQTAAE